MCGADDDDDDDGAALPCDDDPAAAVAVVASGCEQLPLPLVMMTSRDRLLERDTRALLPLRVSRPSVVVVAVVVGMPVSSSPPPLLFAALKSKPS